MKRVVLGTRSSPLALAQAELTREALRGRFPEMEVELATFTTRGDQKLDLSLLQKGEGGGKGLFTKELEDALLDGRIDVAVHSLKDLPGHNPPGLEVQAVLERAPTADILLCREAADLDGLPTGALVGTSSIRRARQLQWLRPDLQITDWRGNVQTRLRKLGNSTEAAGIVLAQAGLDRLGFRWEDGLLRFEEFAFRVSSLAGRVLPAIGQGAIALQASVGRPEVAVVLAAVNHEASLVGVRAERALQRLLSGDCSLPVGVATRVEGAELVMDALLFHGTDPAPVRVQCRGAVNDPETLAQKTLDALNR